MIRIGRRLRPSPAMAVAFAALFVALAGTALSQQGGGGTDRSHVGSKVPGKNGVKASDIATAAVRTNEIAPSAVNSDKFFLSVGSNENVGNVAGGACTTLAMSTPGITASDHVLVTPPPGWTDTFGLVGDPDPANNRVVLQICNLGGGAADPDGGGGGYKVLVIS